MAKKSSVQVNITIPLEWKQSDIEMVAKARAWAVKAHAGQKDKAGKDYFKAHVTVVAEGVKGDPIAEAVAFLHDTVEDTSVTIEDIRTGFPKEVADAVSTLTHSKGISYAEYLWYIQQNSIAVKVKLSDLRSNMDLSRLPHEPTKKDLARTKKYSRAYAMLSGIHDTPYSISEVNPYALYDYLLSTGWEKAEKQKKSSEVVVLKAPADSLTISVPIDMTLPDYETMMGEAVTRLCVHEDAPRHDVLDTIIHWKPLPKEQ